MHHAVLLQVSQYSNVSIKLEIWNRQLQSYTVETWNNLAVEHPWSQDVSTWHLKRITFQSGTPTPLAVEPQTSTVAAFIPFSVLLVPKVRCIYVHLLHLETLPFYDFLGFGDWHCIVKNIVIISVYHQNLVIKNHFLPQSSSLQHKTCYIAHHAKRTSNMLIVK